MRVIHSGDRLSGIQGVPMLEAPRSREDLELLVTTGVPESLHLDYKAGPSLSHKSAKEISKDVSAFANSDGGTIVYGIAERDHRPERVDEGVSDLEITREWLEQQIIANIAPRIEGVIVRQIEVAPGRSAYVVEIPKSFRAPHQDRQSHRYYRRYNFQSVPMEHWEVLDLQGRQGAVAPLFQVRGVVRQEVLCVVEIRNVGSREARDVVFEVGPDLRWRRETPEILARGARAIAPGQQIDLLYNVTYEILREGSEAAAVLELAVSYFDPRLGSRVRDEFLVDFLAYRGTRLPKSDLALLNDALTSAVKAVADSVAKVGSGVSALGALIGPTGLRLSIDALRSIKSVVADGPEAPFVDPLGSEAAAFVEALGVSWELACILEDHFHHTRDLALLEKVVAPGEYDGVVRGLRRWFKVEGPSSPPSGV